FATRIPLLSLTKTQCDIRSLRGRWLMAKLTAALGALLRRLNRDGVLAGTVAMVLSPVRLVLANTVPALDVYGSVPFPSVWFCCVRHFAGRYGSAAASSRIGVSEHHHSSCISYPTRLVQTPGRLPIGLRSPIYELSPQLNIHMRTEPKRMD